MQTLAELSIDFATFTSHPKFGAVSSFLVQNGAVVEAARGEDITVNSGNETVQVKVSDLLHFDLGNRESVCNNFISGSRF